MLVCPQCRFENPNTNKFCQECGVALTQNTCPACGSMVSFDAVNCSECGAIAGVIWWAVMAVESGQSLAASNPEAQHPDSVESVKTSSPDNGTNPHPCYLDSQKRYQIIDSIPALNSLTGEKEMRVLDCQPFQLSPFEALAQQEMKFPGASSRVEASPATAEGLFPQSSSGDEMGSTVQALLVPAIAQPYLALQDQLYQTIPAVHDAWQRDGYQVILLENRTHLPLLLDLWLNEEFSPLPLQILHWLHEIVELWVALEPWKCQQSLLEMKNLRVDEDQTLCLQRLYSDSTKAPPTLVDLGNLWQSFFTQSQRTQFAPIARLLADWDAGRFATAQALRSAIEAIAHEFQVSQSTAEVMPNSNETESSDVPMSEYSGGLASNVLPSSTNLDPETPPTQLEPAQDTVVLVEEDGEGDGEPTVVLPMQLFNLEDFGRTDIGRQREHNEDYFGIETQVNRLESPSGKTVHVRNFYILCDGMGGQADGEIASALAVATLRQFFKETWQADSQGDGQSSKLPGPAVLNKAVQLANKAIYDINQQNARSGSGRMGTTLVMVLIQDTEVAVVHVGDSRLYRYTRKRGLEQITTDHEVGQREMQRGVDREIAYARPDAYQLTQALGPRDEHFVKPDIQYLELNEDSLILLCSDGLTDNDLLETYCKTHVEPLLSSQTNLEQGVTQLIELANQYNGHDNITAIAIRAKVRPNLATLR